MTMTTSSSSPRRLHLGRTEIPVSPFQNRAANRNACTSNAMRNSSDSGFGRVPAPRSDERFEHSLISGPDARALGLSHTYFYYSDEPGSANRPHTTSPTHAAKKIGLIQSQTPARTALLIRQLIPFMLPAHMFSCAPRALAFILPAHIYSPCLIFTGFFTAFRL